MSAVVSQITSISSVCPTAGSGNKKNIITASLAFVREIHRWPECSHLMTSSWSHQQYDSYAISLTVCYTVPRTIVITKKHMLGCERSVVHFLSIFNNFPFVLLCAVRPPPIHIYEAHCIFRLMYSYFICNEIRSVYCITKTTPAPHFTAADIRYTEVCVRLQITSPWPRLVLGLTWYNYIIIDISCGNVIP